MVWFGLVWFVSCVFFCWKQILKYEGVVTIEDVFQFRFPEITFEHFLIGWKSMRKMPKAIKLKTTLHPLNLPPFWRQSVRMFGSQNAPKWANIITMRNFYLPGMGYAGNSSVDSVKSQRSLPLLPGNPPLLKISTRQVHHKAAYGSHASTCPAEKEWWQGFAPITQTPAHSSLERGEKSWPQHLKVGSQSCAYRGKNNAKPINTVTQFSIALALKVRRPRIPSRFQGHHELWI